MQRAQRRPAGRQVLAERVEQPPAEPLDEPGAAVGAGAAAEPEHDPPGAEPQRVRHQLPGAEAGRGERARLAARQPAQPGRLRQLHHRGAVAQRQPRGHRPAGRPADLDLDPAPARRDRRLDGAVPAVGDGQLDDRDVRPRAAQPGGEVAGHLGRGQRAGEPPGRQQDVAVRGRLGGTVRGHHSHAFHAGG
ncbi:hypothetical protein GCM10009527_045300 [Actinomadura nitritigenes]